MRNPVIPTKTLTFLTAAEQCEYLPDRVSRLRYDVARDLRPEAYLTRLQQGWRRFGYAVFRPECPGCTACQSLRVPVESFRPSASQNRAWKRNHGELEIHIGSPTITREKEALFERFHRFGQETKGWPPHEGGLDILANNPFPTEEWSYYSGERLIGLGYVDALPEGLSAIYFGWDPEERDRSLGTFSVLAIIESARTRNLPHVYLGYYVEGCRSLDYKMRFRPNETLQRGAWR